MTSFVGTLSGLNPDVRFGNARDIALTARYIHYDLTQSEVKSSSWRRGIRAVGLVVVGIFAALVAHLLAPQAPSTGLFASLGVFAAVFSLYFGSGLPKLRKFTSEAHPEIIPESVKGQIESLRTQFPDIFVECAGDWRGKRLDGLAYVRIYYDHCDAMLYLHPDLRDGPYYRA